MENLQHVNGTDSTSTLVKNQKYGVFRALNDLFSTIQQNLGTFVLSVVCAYVLSIAALMIVGLILVSFFVGEYGLLFASSGKLLVIAVASIILYLFWYAFAVAFTTCALSFPLYDTTLKLKGVFNKSLAVLPRLVKTNLLVGLVAFLPLMVLTLLSTAAIFAGRGATAANGIASGVLSLFLGIAAVVWIVIAILRYALAPLVAIFEPNVPVTQTLARSRHLLIKGGQWFLVKGIVLMLVVMIITVALLAQPGENVRDGDNTSVNVAFMLLSVIGEGALVMLYKNRRAVKG